MPEEVVEGENGFINENANIPGEGVSEITEDDQRHMPVNDAIPEEDEEAKLIEISHSATREVTHGQPDLKALDQQGVPDAYATLLLPQDDDSKDEARLFMNFLILLIFTACNAGRNLGGACYEIQHIHPARYDPQQGDVH
eukprot:gene9406-10394_t